MVEIKFYEIGGPSELRFVFSFREKIASCSAFWKNNVYNLDIEVLPVDATKITGTLCQYMLKTLSKLTQNNEVTDLIRSHVTEMSGYINLMVRIGYEKFDKSLKNRLLICMQKGISLWKNLIRCLTSWADAEFKNQVIEIVRYIIIYEVILFDYFTEMKLIK